MTTTTTGNGRACVPNLHIEEYITMEGPRPGMKELSHVTYGHALIEVDEANDPIFLGGVITHIEEEANHALYG